ncbi:MAG: hypothetical protein MJ237_08320 [bacterium]|nr:hypothetical protein [bacterium]
MAIKKTANQIEYEKQVKRLKQAMKRAEKEGYIFDATPIPTARPKRVTKKLLKELKELTPKKLKAQYAYYETPEKEKRRGLMPKPPKPRKPRLTNPSFNWIENEPDFTPPPDTTAEKTDDIIQSIYDLLEDIPDSRWTDAGGANYVNTGARRDAMRAALDSNLQSAINAGQKEEYLKMLREKYPEIQDAIEGIIGESREENIDKSYMKFMLTIAFNGFNLNMAKQTEKINNMIVGKPEYES